MAMGRPTQYKPEFCEMLIKHMDKGFSITSFGAVVECSRDTLYEWAAKHKDFSDAMKAGKTKSALHHEKVLQMMAHGKIKGGNVAAQIFMMKNQLGWKDRVEIQDEREEKFVPLPGMEDDDEDE